MAFIKNRALHYGWIGIVLGALFFFPIAATLGEEIYYLHWRFENTLELAICWVLLSLAFGFCYWGADLIENIILKGLAVNSVFLFPFSSFFIHICRILDLESQLFFLAEIFREYKIVIIIILGCALVFVFYSMQAIIELEKKVVIFLSPVAFIVLFNIVTTFDQDEVVKFQGSVLSQARNSGNSKLPDIFILLFDEMSYQFLYEGMDIRPELPNIRGFSEISENYHEAYSPAHNTLVAVPGLIKGEALGEVVVRRNNIFIKEREGFLEKVNLNEKNIFADAKRRGFNTIMIGWYHSYCELLASTLDFCRAFSLYNYGSTNDSFSLVDPIFTNIILWPSQFPFYLIKNYVSAMHQRNMVKNTLNLSLNSFEFEGPLFQFVHFSIPHVPFVFDSKKFKVPPRPFEVSAQNYLKQLKFVDHVFGKMLDELKRRKRFQDSVIVLISDHNYREMAKLKNWNQKQIPLLIKRRNQQEKITVLDRVEAEIILGGIGKK